MAILTDGTMRLTAIFLHERVKSDVKEWSEKGSIYPFKFGIPLDNTAATASYPKGRFIVSGMTPIRFGWVRIKDIKKKKYLNWSKVKIIPADIATIQVVIEHGEYEPYDNIPPVIDIDGNLIAGFTRLEAHILEKEEYMWCLICDFDNEDVKKEYNAHENITNVNFPKVELNPNDIAQIIWKGMKDIRNGNSKINRSLSGATKWLRENKIKKKQGVIAKLAMDLFNSGQGITPMVSFSESKMKKIHEGHFGKTYKHEPGVSQAESLGSIFTVRTEQEFHEQRRLIHSLECAVDGSPKNITIQLSGLASSKDFDKQCNRYRKYFLKWLPAWAKKFSEADFSNVRITVVNPLNEEGEIIE